MSSRDPGMDKSSEDAQKGAVKYAREILTIRTNDLSGTIVI